MTVENHKPDPEERESDKDDKDDDYNPAAFFFEEAIGAKEVEALNNSIEELGSQINTSRD